MGNTPRLARQLEPCEEERMRAALRASKQQQLLDPAMENAVFSAGAGCPCKKQPNLTAASDPAVENAVFLAGAGCP